MITFYAPHPHTWIRPPVLETLYLYYSDRLMCVVIQQVKWGDKDGSYGEQYWDLNHGGAGESAYDNVRL